MPSSKRNYHWCKTDEELRKYLWAILNFHCDSDEQANMLMDAIKVYAHEYRCLVDEKKVVPFHYVLPEGTTEDMHTKNMWAQVTAIFSACGLDEEGNPIKEESDEKKD